MIESFGVLALVVAGARIAATTADARTRNQRFANN
jgi:hypothetical protein